MSHEIRTPLWVILGMTEALRQQGLSDQDRQRFLETIERTGHDLTRIVNDLLDISKIEANHMEIELSRFNLRGFISDLKTTLVSQLAKNQNRLIIEESINADSEIVTDRLRLRQILLNLLGNALKFTKQGTVTLKCVLKDRQLDFFVTDTGIGISKENGSELFKPFSQIDPSTTRKFGGTGLGLFLSKRLANILHGDLVLDKSALGKGSRFHLRVHVEVAESLKPEKVLQLKPEAAKPSSSTPNGELLGKKVLVVDDAPDNRILFQYFLKKWGVEVTFAENGQEGMEKALEHQFDVVLMDMQMPILDGYEATKRLRSMGYNKPIVAVTAHAMKEDRDHCLEVGCNDYVSKPIQSDTLYKLIKEVVATPA
jgi:CheY-like chemotaxis protein